MKKYKIKKINLLFFLYNIEEKRMYNCHNISKKINNLQKELEEFENKKIINQLKSLIDDRKSFISEEEKDDKDNIFVKDIEALEKAIIIIKNYNMEV